MQNQELKNIRSEHELPVVHQLHDPAEQGVRLEQADIHRHKVSTLCLGSPALYLLADGGAVGPEEVHRIGGQLAIGAQTGPDIILGWHGGHVVRR